MKRLLAILFTVIFVMSLSACGTDNRGQSGTGQGGNDSTMQSGKADTVSTDAKLTADEALDIALKDASVAKESIRDLENRLDRENGVLVYEIDFKSGNREYSYDINAVTGVIVDRDRDRED